MNHGILRRVLILPVFACVALASGTYLEGYSNVGHTWSTTRVNYYVNPASKWVSAAAAVSAVQSAAAVWKTQSNANIELVYGGTTNGSSLTFNGKNEVFFRDAGSGNVAETWYWWDGSGHLVDFDMIFNEGAYQFFAGSGCSGGIYIENVGVHEFGHALGLGHSSVPNVTMQPAMQSYCDTTQLSLEGDDIAGIQEMYPNGSFAPSPSPSRANTAPSVSIQTPSDGASIVEGTIVTFSASASDPQDGNISHRLVWTADGYGQIATGASFAVAMIPGTFTIRASVQDSGGMAASSRVSVTGTLQTVFSPGAASSSATARVFKNRGLQ